MDKDIPDIIRPPGFQYQYVVFRILAEPVGKHTPGRAAANNDIVICFFHLHNSFLVLSIPSHQANKSSYQGINIHLIIPDKSLECHALKA